ncbi:unnamed protein product [Chrysoparadoxa australica]
MFLYSLKKIFQVRNLWNQIWEIVSNELDQQEGTDGAFRFSPVPYLKELVPELFDPLEWKGHQVRIRGGSQQVQQHQVQGKKKSLSGPSHTKGKYVLTRSPSELLPEVGVPQKRQRSESGGGSSSRGTKRPRPVGAKALLAPTTGAEGRKAGDRIWKDWDLR